MTRLAALGFVAFLVGACNVMPAHDVKPTPAFVQAGIKPGDHVEVLTRDGKDREIIVTDVSATEIRSADETIPITSIISLKKRSWAVPAHPCGAGEPVGCSVPQVLLILSDDLQDQVDKFSKPCATHDFCYRHGHATYGASREDCDTDFYDDMRRVCGADGVLGLFDPEDRALCEVTANRAYEAVRAHGGPAYRTTTSTYCEYR